MEKIYQIALSNVEGVGSVFFRQLISYCGSAENVFKAKTDKLLKIPGVGKTIIEGLKRKEILKEAEQILQKSENQQVVIFFSTDKNYPFRLKPLYDAPAVLYYRGNADLNHFRSLGIVGTRQATDYGRKTTEDLVEQSKPYNPLIISGLAYGIDITAHKAAIEYNLPTIAVMASGIDVIYPNQHEKYIEQILNHGGIISEHPFGKQPIRNMFLARNRIIAGLSDVSIVIESASKGGAMVTAEFANNYHREVFAIPGTLSNKFSEGCNQLIKQNKAHIYTNINDIVESLNWDLTENNDNQPIKESLLDLSTFTDEEGQVIAILRTKGEMHIDELSWQTQIPINRLASLLLNLEFQGIIKTMPGKKFGLK
ncbi:DNA protecting protein DprA [Emticicia oligotrophica DSM 17448]|uniref:DNA protecting protein DprA n=1 Tax=Emticicia oligotrophica (strain DSM 17448 / CIP 109782 / MTCC 6937 / GPTSA100-15) TaxID=929562 RepID=A0ABM5MWM9_EMTOG|nr:DNA-processing protein DprA [Emticicia oligotrophica]AFK01513.1 DNA protecting protein DprA [Emticicia oligotrophica DSM 17448]